MSPEQTPTAEVRAPQALDRIRSPLCVVLLLLLAGLAFLPAVGHDYTGWDDTLYVAQNPWMTAPDGLWQIWTSPDNEHYYPVTFTSYWIEYQLFGPGPAAYLATNVLLHAVSAVGVWLLLRRLAFSRLAALFGAAVWALHPTQAISVGWIAERKNVLAFLFCWITLWAWIGWRERGGLARYVAACAAFALALLSKTQFAGLPFVLIVLDVFRLRVPWRRAVAASSLPLAMAVASSSVTAVFERKLFIDPVDPEFVLPLPERVLQASTALLRYVGLVAWPVDLSPMYPLWDVELSGLLWWLAPALLIVLVVLLVRELKKGDESRIDGRLLLGAALFVIWLGPILGILPYGNLPLTPVSDHYLYGALLGPAIACALLLEHVVRRSWLRPRTALVLATAWVAFLLFQLERTLPYYSNGRAMWERSLVRSPDNFAAHLGLAEIEHHDGDHDSAREHYRRATQIEPLWVGAWERWGSAEVEAGRLDLAEPALRRSLELVPSNPRAQLSYARLLEQRGRPAEALPHYEESVRLDRRWIESRLALGGIYLGYARYADAEEQFRKAVYLAGGRDEGYLGLATSLRGLGDVAGALRTLEEGLQVLPENATLLNLLARMLATTTDDRLRDGARARELALAACRVADDGDPLPVETLAASEAECGDAASAAATQTRAATLWRARGQAARAAAAAELAERYADGFRERR